MVGPGAGPGLFTRAKSTFWWRLWFSLIKSEVAALGRKSETAQGYPRRIRKVCVFATVSDRSECSGWIEAVLFRRTRYDLLCIANVSSGTVLPSSGRYASHTVRIGNENRKPIGSVRWTSFLHNNLFRLWGKYCGGEGVTFLLFNNGKKENRRVGGGRRANWVRLSESRVNDSRLLKEHCPREQVSEENTLRQNLTGDSVKTVLLPIKKQEMTAELWQVDRVERRKIGEGPDRVPDSVEMSPDECSCVGQFN
jgi:hypothetical protein